MLTTTHKKPDSNTLTRTRRGQGKNFYFINICMRYFTVSKVLGVIAIVLVMAFIMTSIKAIDALLDVPIESVSIEGDSEFSSRELIQDIINASSVDGFVGLDLSSLHDKLQSLPWIRYVSIKRKIPNKLVIYIEEEMVVARWSDQGYLTKNGDVVISKRLDNLDSFSFIIG